MKSLQLGIQLFSLANFRLENRFIACPKFILRLSIISEWQGSPYFATNICIFSAQKKTIPWKPILSSIPFWSLMLAHFGQNWGFFTLFTKMPAFIGSVLHVDIAEVIIKHLVQIIEIQRENIRNLQKIFERTQKIRVLSLRVTNFVFENIQLFE